VAVSGSAIADLIDKDLFVVVDAVARFARSAFWEKHVAAIIALAENACCAVLMMSL
jgi:hypothetical protein